MTTNIYRFPILIQIGKTKEFKVKYALDLTIFCDTI